MSMISRLADRLLNLVVPGARADAATCWYGRCRGDEGVKQLCCVDSSGRVTCSRCPAD
ncbi:hypothetical protein [Longispora albida]|uniref:hypothetical protein n=1 Tax=Longispora albida TaxID=203523 RepID=UPI0003A9E8AD|nr:hypothetical protein [Longispora albida]